MGHAQARESMEERIVRALKSFPTYGCTMHYAHWIAAGGSGRGSRGSMTAKDEAAFRAAWARSRKDRIKLGGVGNASRWAMRPLDDGKLLPGRRR